MSALFAFEFFDTVWAVCITFTIGISRSQIALPDRVQRSMLGERRVLFTAFGSFGKHASFVTDTLVSLLPATLSL